MLLSVFHRYSDEFTLLVNCPCSHCIEEGNFQGEFCGLQYQDPNNRNGDRGNCEFDHLQLFDSSSFASMPQFKGTGMRRLFSDRESSAIFTKHSGSWFNPSTGAGQSLTGTGHDRPDLVPGVSATVPDPNIARWFNSAAFVPKALGTFGNVGRNSLEGPGAADLDTAFLRRFPVRESQTLELHFEAFNAFNRARFDSSQTSLRSRQSAQITGASDPRILQFVLKYSCGK